MTDRKLLVNGEYLLEKFPGKGGWTYAEIPEIKQDKKNPFGWVKVSGSIDHVALEHYKLMPMGNGKLFLPVKAAIRKQLKKEKGDTVHVQLYIEESLFKIPEELLACFENEPKECYAFFKKCTKGEQKAYIDWIYNAKTDETKANRIVKMMDRLHRGLKYYDKELTID